MGYQSVNLNRREADVAIWGSINQVPLQIEAALANLGIAHLPCFAAASIDGLVPATEKTVNRHDLRLLRHKDTRSTERLRVFSTFIAQAFRDRQTLFDAQSLGDSEPMHP